MNIDRATSALANMKRNATAKRASGSLDPVVRPLADGQLICPNCHRSDHYSGGWPSIELDNGLQKSKCDGCGADVTWIHPSDYAKWPND